MRIGNQSLISERLRPLLKFLLLSGVFPLFLALLACNGLQDRLKPGQAPSSESDLILLQLNDVYEISPLENGKFGGMARVAALRKELLGENPNTISILSGDFLSPSVIGTVKIDGERVQGAQMVDVMNAVGIDLVTFGNHEFDLKESDLQKRIEQSKFDWISSNVLHTTPTGKEPFYKLINGERKYFPRLRIVPINLRDGRVIRVGFIAVTIPFNMQPYVTYEDVFEKAGEAYAKAREESDFVIAITHLNLAQDIELARRLPELALIIGGHDHENSYERVGEVPIAKADANAKTAYVHRVLFNSERHKAEVQSDLVKLDASVPADRAVAALVTDWENKATAAFAGQGFNLKEPIASLSEPLDGLEKDIRVRQTNLGDLITGAILKADDDVDLVVFNSGSIRIDDYVRGEITELDLVRILPFGGEILTVRMKGDLVERLLNVGRANIGTGGFLHTANVSERDKNWLIAGQPLDREKAYEVAITDFLMSGREINLDFLTDKNPGVLSVSHPEPGSLLSDVRYVLRDELIKSR